MAVTPISPPVGELPATTTPVRFSVDNLVALTIIVDHSDDEVSRPPEPVYINDRGVGIFFYPYAASSTLVGNTFTILREGGWGSFEERNKVRVFEQTAVPTGGLALTSIYDLDLTAQPSQSMAAAGSYTIDGKTWWAKGAIGGAGDLCELVNGSGLRLFQPATIDGGAARPLWRGQAGYGARLWAFALSQLTAFNADAPFALEWRFTSPAALSTTSTRVPFAGVADVAASSAAITTPEKAKALTLGQFDTAASFFARDPYATGSADVNPGGNTDTVSGHNVNGLYRFSKSRWYPLLGAYAGSLGVPDDNMLADLGINAAYANGSLSTSPSFIYLLNKGFSDGATLDVFLTHLRVLQPKVA